MVDSFVFPTFLPPQTSGVFLPTKKFPSFHIVIPSLKFPKQNLIYLTIHSECYRAEVNCRDNFKWTPLHHACHAGQLELVKLLLDRGAELDAQTINGGTPIMRAIESSREDVVEFLIAKG